MIFELTGIPVTKIVIENQKEEQKAIEELTHKHIARGNLVIAMGEGISGKKLKLQGD